MLFLGKKKWRPSQISQSINSPTRVALMCSSSHHLTWNAIPWNLSNQRPAWDPPCWSGKLPWTAKSRVHITELLCLPAPSSFLFLHGVETSWGGPRLACYLQACNPYQFNLWGPWPVDPVTWLAFWRTGVLPVPFDQLPPITWSFSHGSFKISRFDSEPISCIYWVHFSCVLVFWVVLHWVLEGKKKKIVLEHLVLKIEDCQIWVWS